MAMNQDDVSGMVLLLFSELLLKEKSAGRMPFYVSWRRQHACSGLQDLDAANLFEKYGTDGNVDVCFGIHQEAANKQEISYHLRRFIKGQKGEVGAVYAEESKEE